MDGIIYSHTSFIHRTITTPIFTSSRSNSYRKECFATSSSMIQTQGLASFIMATNSTKKNNSFSSLDLVYFDTKINVLITQTEI